ncbi:MAG TPA: dihydrodipicolinate synthase family protein [Thermomicrobiales bacterium]|nr:dihydrodipicolinate synthase family protein [Thermomicrobiales bacterium]
MIDIAALQGVWAALPVPWAANGTVDSGLVAELVQRYRAAGVDGVYTTGTDGEMHVLEWEDIRRLVDAFAAAVQAAGLPAQVGCTWSHTEGVLRRMRYAQERGIGCVQVALPSWVPLGDDEVRRFFAELQAGCPDVCLVHYNIARAGRFLTGRDYLAILEVAPNLVGTKHTGGDAGSLIEIVQATPTMRHFVVDQQIVPGALFGSKGFYSFLVNLSPRFAVELWRDCRRGDWTEAARKRVVADAFFRDWLREEGLPTASPALAKIATRAGIFPEMPLAVRAPYRAGTAVQVAALRALLEERYRELSYEIR